MSVSFNLNKYKLTCQALESRLIMRLQPLEVENKNVVHYLYQGEYRDPNLPEGIKYLFNELTTDWYRYIEFYQEKCFDLNDLMIRNDQDSEPNRETEYTQLPFVFKIKVMEGIKESKFKLYGSKELFSKELKLERLLVVKENVILDLQKSLHQKGDMIEELKLKLNQSDQQKEELRQQISRLREGQLPNRKRIHYNEEPGQQGSMSQNNNDYRLGQNQESNSTTKSKNSQMRNSNSNQGLIQNLSIQNQPSFSNPTFSEANQRNDLINERSITEIPQHQSVQKFSKHSQTFFNRPNKSQTRQNQSISYVNETKNMNLDILSATLQNARQIEEKKQDQKVVHHDFHKLSQNTTTPVIIAQMRAQTQTPIQTQKPTQIPEKIPSQPMTMQPSTLPHSQTITINGQIFTDEKIRMVKEFASKKCHLEVGFDDNNHAKYGFCCVFCEKVFKEDEFLTKHLFSRHPEINNETSMDYLNGILLHYKRRREQKILAIEANHAAERKQASRSQALQGRT